MSHAPIAGRDGLEVRGVAERLALDAPPRRPPIRGDEVLVRDGPMRAGLGFGSRQDWLAALPPGLERLRPSVEAARLPVWLVAHEDLSRSRSLRAAHGGLVEALEQMCGDGRADVEACGDQEFR